MPWARASSMDRLVTCAGSLWLPRKKDDDSLKAEMAADWGHGLHEWKATGQFTGIYREQLRARVERSKKLDREAMWPGGVHERCYAFNSVTRAIGVYEGGTEDERDAWKAAFGDEWSTGTSDFESWYLDEVGRKLLWIDDLKTGSVDPRYPPTPPGKSAQVRWYALAACRSRLYHGPVHVSITHIPRPASPETIKVRSPLAVTRYEDELTAQQIDDFERHLQRVRAEVLARGPYRPTKEHCRFCSGYENCPERYEYE